MKKCSLVGILMTFAGMVHAGPNIVHYQGTLLDPGGKPAGNQSYRMRFALYDAAVGGTQQWQEEDAALEVSDGLFSTVLGDGTPFPAGLFSSYSQLFLEVAIDLNGNGTYEDPDEIFSPRRQLLSTPWAIEADELGGYAPSDFQRRVTGTAPVGHYITAINEDGSVVSAPDQTGGGGGDITSVAAGPGLTGGGTSGSVSLAVAFGNGGTSSLVSRADHTHLGTDVESAVATATLALSSLQAPWSGLTGVPAGFADGIDNDTRDWGSLTGIPAGFADGVDNDSGGDITAVTPGPGLDGGALSGDATLFVLFDGTGSVDKVARSDHFHTGGAYWSLGGNGGTTPTTNFLGTTDNVPLELRANSSRALRLEPTTISPNIVGGYAGNTADPGVWGATVGGGGSRFALNRVTDFYGTVGGGAGNTAGDSAGTVSDVSAATVAGGSGNTASGSYATVAGGINNTASTESAVVAGGSLNTAGGAYATVAGGQNNRSTARYATVGGGLDNASTAVYATIPGGWWNKAGGQYSTVGGGARNTASAGFASVGGGSQNASTNFYATIPGGLGNSATGDYTSVGGGRENASTNSLATISGGYRNKAGGDSAAVGGGRNNTAGRDCATVGGGYNNASIALYSTVAGGTWNTVSGAAATVGGGDSNTASGLSATVGGGYDNASTATYSTVAGGWSNTAGRDSATVAGGDYNTASGLRSTVGGGGLNTASGDSATVAGGYQSTASGWRSTVGGGLLNRATRDYATVGGGQENACAALYATIPGGYLNAAAGDYSFAAGRRAKANNIGSFAWADSTDADFDVNNDNRFAVRASGGVYLYANSALTAGSYLAAGSGTWASVSDRNMKENVKGVDGKEVLDKLATIPVTTWNYKSEETSVRHMGPMAQDLRAAFGLGDSDKSIATIDADGISLAAIQGLHQLVQEKNAEIEILKADRATQQERIDELEARLLALERHFAQE